MKKLLALIILVLFVSGCSTNTERILSLTTLGAATGAIIGHQSGNLWEGASIGAGVGAISGLIWNDILRDMYPCPR